MPAWPGTLPASPLMDSFRETVPDTVLRTETDQGPAKLRQRTTAGVRRLSLSYIMSQSQISDLENFFLVTLMGGALGFDFTHPRTEETETCRFRQPPEYAPLNGNFFRVAVDLEVLP